MGLVQLIRCRIFGYLRAALFDGDLDGLANFLKDFFHGICRGRSCACPMSEAKKSPCKIQIE
jgi:hypothetical protein